MPFALDAYLARTGASTEPPSLAALGALQTAHVRTFAFDDVDVLLGQHPGVGLDAVAEKFVDRGRGGYCFEHATLLHAVVTALGYDAQLRLARVGDPQQAPRTHLAVVVTIDGTRYLSDPGIGVPPLGPIELRDGARLKGGIWEHEIRRVDEGGAGPAWQLWRQRVKGWELMHSTDELPVRPVDVVMGHHYTSTHPASHFTRTLTVARHHVDADGRPVHMTLTLDGLQIRRAGEETQLREVADEEIPEVCEEIGAHLTDDEGGRLVERVRELRAWA